MGRRTHKRRWVALALAGVALGGCGGSGGNGRANRATCDGGVLSLVGDLDGRPFDVKVTTNSGSLVFQQDALPYTLDVSYNGGTLHLEWSTAVSLNGAPSAATGTFVMPYDGPTVSDPICAADGTVSES